MGSCHKDVFSQSAGASGRDRVLIAISKKDRKTNPVERLNGTLRQRLSRRVRATLSFSKKRETHIGAIRYFLCHYNLELTKA